MWVEVDELRQGLVWQKLNLWARIREGDGGYRSLLLGELSNPNAASGDVDNEPDSESREEAPESVRPGWIYLETGLPQNEASRDRSQALVSFFISKGTTGALTPSSIGLDDVTIRGTGIPAPGVVIEDYEMAGTWEPLPHQGDEMDTVDYTPEGRKPGSAGLRFLWREPLGKAPRGVFLAQSPYPLPAIGSRSFHTGQLLRFRDGKQVLPVVIRDVIDFPPRWALSPSLSCCWTGRITGSCCNSCPKGTSNLLRSCGFPPDRERTAQK